MRPKISPRLGITCPSFIEVPGEVYPCDHSPGIRKEVRGDDGAIRMGKKVVKASSLQEMEGAMI